MNNLLLFDFIDDAVRCKLIDVPNLLNTVCVQLCAFSMYDLFPSDFGILQFAEFKTSIVRLRAIGDSSVEKAHSNKT